MKMQFDPVYRSADVEEKWYSLWMQHGIFHGRVDPSRKVFSMVIPPPNITGSLHMGHALNNTIQDILVRWRRLQGYSTCWFPGTDHAGIATQVVVERELWKEKRATRHDVGREAFLEQVWEWKKKYGGIIDEQLKKLGVSCDWSRYSFTMDEMRAKAVREAFVRLYGKGLIYRDEYIVNWCPRCQTALSDLEVEHPEKEPPGVLYYLRYRLEEPVDGRSHVTIATVRPETILADVAIAVHPSDPRYQKLIGKFAILPLAGRKLQIISDEWADPAVGSGAVKITPAHDPNDFEVGRRHHLSRISVIDLQGKMRLSPLLQERGIPEDARKFLKKYEGLDRFACREEIVLDLKAQGFLEKEEPWEVHAGRCARSGDVIEPALSLQWFLRTKPLAEPAIAVAREKGVQFHPERFEKLYLDWMENLRDWCVSRQLWWGHQIPAWYCAKCEAGKISLSDAGTGVAIGPGAKPIVGLEKPSGCPGCGSTELIQDPDVLDTWFSSALWPLSVMGWPAETEDLRYFYPTSALSTSRDILFLWVSRMIMMGLEFRGAVPFSHVYIHSTILDREGRRMSKSKGTGVDPLDLIAKYGADATRFGMIMLAQNQDAKFNEEKIVEARNFANKIWNASRFILSNLPGNFQEEVRGKEVKPETFADRWILFRLSRLIPQVTENLENYEFARAASLLYDFFWEDFCDWYLELSKLSLQGKEEKAAFAARAILLEVLRASLILLHPFLPFVTEEIWHQAEPSGGFLGKAAWPEARLDSPPEPLMDSFQEVVREIRNLRAETGVKPKDRVPVLIRSDRIDLYRKMEEELKAFAQSSALTLSANHGDPPGKALSARLTGGSVYLLMEGIALESEIRRLQSGQGALLQEMEGVKRRLGDKNFVEKAKPEVIAGAREREKQLQEKISQIQARLASLKGL